MSMLTCTRQFIVVFNVQTIFRFHHYHIKLFWLFFSRKIYVSLVYFLSKRHSQVVLGEMAISPHFSLDDLKPLVKLKGRHLTSLPCSSTVTIINVLLHLLSLVQSNSYFFYVWSFCKIPNIKMLLP